MNKDNGNYKTPTEHVAEAERLYHTNAVVHAFVETAAQLMEMAVHSHTGEPMPDEHRGVARLAMLIVLYVQQEEPGLN